MKKGLFFLSLLLFIVCSVFAMGVPDYGYGRSSAGGGGLIATFLPFIVIIIIILVAMAISKGKRGNSPSLILEEFSLNENEDEFLRIKGRASGLWNWILSLFDKAPMTCLTFNKQLLKYEESNIKYNIPLFNITCVSSGMLKSSVLLLIIGILTIFMYGIGIIFIVVWALNRKTMHFGIYINENAPMVTIKMKRGIIDSIDLNKFENAARILNEIVLKNGRTK